MFINVNKPYFPYSALFFVSIRLEFLILQKKFTAMKEFKLTIVLLLFGLFSQFHINGQDITSYKTNLQEVKPEIDTSRGFKIRAFDTPDGEHRFQGSAKPMFTVIIDGKQFSGEDAQNITATGKGYYFNLAGMLEGEVMVNDDFSDGWKADFKLENLSDDTLIIENFVPFGESNDHVYITSTGPWNLARSKIFIPGRGPVGVILPDNAWELGFSTLRVDKDFSVYGLARRSGWEGSKRRRYKNEVYPGGEITWTIWMESYQGDWQEGLRKAFQQRWLYDLEDFDNTLFDREDLQWIRHDYLIALQMAWDHEFYDAFEKEYTVKDFLAKGEEYMGGYDVYSIWPTWPRLGVDQRNQWDLYEDLPGGLPKIREMANYCQDRGTKFFIAYNPWDQSTRTENPYTGMARLISATDADGVILDTRGASSYELQNAADSVRKGVVMYSEGMAVPNDMPGIVSGRVHNAIAMPPPLNLNKLIKPDFGIFRVSELRLGSIRREANISLFNGYGIEMNTYYPGRPDWVNEEFLYLGKIVKVLRENSANFNSYDWIPLLPATTDSIWVNYFPGKAKDIFTVYSLNPEGFNGPLFKADIPENHHLVSLWHHEEICADTIDRKIFSVVSTAAFNKTSIGTRRESSVDVIAVLPDLLSIRLKIDSLFVNADIGNKIVISAGNPTYQSEKIELAAGNHALKLYDYFGRYEGKITVQLFDRDDQLMDERIAQIPLALPRLISETTKTPQSETMPEGMVKIHAGTFIFEASNPDQFIPYPKNSNGDSLLMKDYWVDEFPVTNADYARFLTESGYAPENPKNFLKHWTDGNFPDTLANYPVVYVTPEDASAYCRFYGKRLPTETEWQYAAQGTDGRKWPWGNDFDSTHCNNALGHSTPVNRYPQVASPFGVQDMVGNVWQLTADNYDDGAYYFTIMKGGSFYKPTSSWWYVQGGPQPVDHQQMLLRVTPPFDRNATVGFRCVKDAE